MNKLKEKKKLIIILSSVLLASAILLSVGLFLLLSDDDTEKPEEIFVYGDFEYSLLGENEIEIISYLGSTTDIVIPTGIDSRAVTSIADKAFMNSEITSVKLGIFVKEIGDYAFAASSKLISPFWILARISFAFSSLSSIKN